MSKHAVQKESRWSLNRSKSMTSIGSDAIASLSRGSVCDNLISAEGLEFFRPKEGARFLSRPEKGRSVAAAARKFGSPFREAVNELQSSCLRLPTDLLRLLDDCSPTGPGAKKSPESARLASFLVNVYIMESILAKGEGSTLPSTLQGTLDSFLGGNTTLNPINLTNCYPAEVLSKVEVRLQGQSYGAELTDLLPYVLEEHGQVMRSEVSRCVRSRAERAKKKEAGSYYTPSDVADFMVKALLEGADQNGPWLDPACGSGVFARAVLKAVSSRMGHPSDPGRLMLWCIENIFGIDINEQALDNAAFLLLTDIENLPCAFQSATEPRLEKWLRLRRNFLAADTLSIAPALDSKADPQGVSLQGKFSFSLSDIKIDDLFPAGPNQFRFGILNPPYSAVPMPENQCDYVSYRDVNPNTESVPAVPGFVEFLVRAIAPDGRASCVLPLSVACSSRVPYRSLRRFFDRAESKFEFHCYDREPHALFGEDVRTRSTIAVIHRDAQEQGIWTTSLQQWSSHERQRIFDAPHMAKLSGVSIQDLIPKLGSANEADSYMSLMRSEGGGSIAPLEVSRIPFSESLNVNDIRSLFVGSTGYRYLSVSRAGFGIDVSIERPSSNPVTKLGFCSERASFVGMAVLSSNIARWLWRVEGDGFHVNGQFLKRLPLWNNRFSPEEQAQLEKLGRAIWREMKRRPKLAVNKRRQTVSFHPDNCGSITREVDRILVSHFDLAPGLLQEVHGG